MSQDLDDPQALRERLQASEAERLDLQRQLAQRDAQLAAAHQDAEEFLHMVGHDLRAPLRHVMAYTTLVREMLASGEDPHAGLATLAQSSQRLGRMVDALVELARLGRAPLSPCTLPAAVVVREAQREAQAALAAPSAQLVEWHIADDFPAVHGDPAQLRLAWRQLIANALKFSRRQPVARIELGWLPAVGDQGQLRFFVRDNGVGFNMAQADRLFAPFGRLHGTTEFEGLGTGLAQFRQIVRRHGGQVHAVAGMGEGCTMWFTLPAAPSA